MEKDWQIVFSTKKPYKAEMVRGLLETAGLEPVIMNQQDSSYLFGDIEVYVAPTQVEQALSVIKNVENE